MFDYPLYIKEVCYSLNETHNVRCIRSKGHKGNCWTKWERDKSSPQLTRCEWTIYESGEFNFNVGYVFRPYENVW